MKRLKAEHRREKVSKSIKTKREREEKKTEGLKAFSHGKGKDERNRKSVQARQYDVVSGTFCVCKCVSEPLSKI